MPEPVIQTLTAVERPPSPSGARTLARFTVDLDGVRIFGLLLRELPDGSRRTVAPNLGGQHVATFRRDLAEQITAAASAALYGGRFAAEQRHRTA
jgi:hypothetical protein